MPLPLSLITYMRGGGGVPTTTPLVDLSSLADSYQHTISATGGFESASIGFTGTVGDTLFWLQNLGAALIATGPDANIIWEGMLSSVDATVGQEKRSLSLDSMANRVVCRYQTVLGTAGTTSRANNTSSQGRYGIKEYVLTLNETNAATAAAFRDAELARRAEPRMTPASTIATGDMGDVQITLTFAGWYYALDWLTTANTTTSTAATETQVANLITSYNAVNAFIASTSIVPTGISPPQTIATDTTYRAAIEKLFASGTSAGQRLAWGVYEARAFQAVTWAGAAPSVITYRRYLGEGLPVNAGGATVLPWNVRPNAMLEVVDLLDPGPVASAPDAAARFFIERISFHASGDTFGVDLEPAASDGLDSRLARLGAT